MKHAATAICLLVCFFTVPAFALVEETTTEVSGSVMELEDSPSRGLKDLVQQFVDVPAGAVDWRMLGETGEKKISGQTPEGYDFEYYSPEFTKDVAALDGKTVAIKGFMFPLDASEEQSTFLFGPFPVGCPFHYHVAPALVMEVRAARPVAFSYDAVTLQGRLELVKKDTENSTFYRLQDARKIAD